MPRRKRPPIPVHLSLPDEPPTQAEIDVITSALLGAGLMATNGIPLLFHTAKGWEHVKQLWVARILYWFAGWQAAGAPERVWPRLEQINQQIKYLLLETLRAQPRPEFAPILRAWFPHEVRKVRAAINRTLQSWGERPSLYPP